jgi:cell division protein FtsX
MRRIALAVSLATVAVTGTALAVPALASPATSSVAASVRSADTTQAAAAAGLTPEQQQELDDFLAAHPRVAEALVKRIEQWKTFAQAHPDLVAELKKVAALPREQRHAELSAWLKDHPDDATAWHQLRQQVRQERQDRRDQRRERRQERRTTTGAGS